MRGTIIGNSAKAKNTARQRTFERTSRKAAGTPISIDRMPVAIPMMSERNAAEPQVGACAITPYHCSEKPCGGQSIAEALVNDTGIINSVGAIRNTSVTMAIAHSAGCLPLRPCRGGQTRLNAAPIASHSVASDSSTAKPARRASPFERCPLAAEVGSPPVSVDSPIKRSYSTNTISTVTSSNSEIAPAKPQFSVCSTWSMINCVIMVWCGPPSSAGVMKKPSAVTNTMIAAAATPGSDSGK